MQKDRPKRASVIHYDSAFLVGSVSESELVNSLARCRLKGQVGVSWSVKVTVMALHYIHRYWVSIEEEGFIHVIYGALHTAVGGVGDVGDMTGKFLT